MGSELMGSELKQVCLKIAAWDILHDHSEFPAWSLEKTLTGEWGVYESGELIGSDDTPWGAVMKAADRNA